MLKPDQGGSGARIQVVDSLEQVEEIFRRDPAFWFPDNLFLLQEYLPHDPEQGIVRLEFLGGELLYAMRVKTHGRFNLCPSPVCNPDDGDGVCEVPAGGAAPPVEFFPYPGGARARRSSQRGALSRRRSWTSAASSTSRHPTAAVCSTTSTRTRTCDRQWRRRSVSIRSSAWSTSCRRKSRTALPYNVVQHRMSGHGNVRPARDVYPLSIDQQEKTLMRKTSLTAVLFAATAL